MPLPNDWLPTFYDKETCGDLLFDLEPAEFLGVAEASGDSMPFLYAGAYYDLFANGCKERAAAYFGFAKERWPERDWDEFAKVLEAAAKARPQCLDAATRSPLISSMLITMMVEAGFG